LAKSAAREQFDRMPPARALSERTFGLALPLALALALIAFSPLRHGGVPRWWSLGVAWFITVALWRASWLHPLATVWAQLLRSLNAAVAWAVMGLLFRFVIIPVGLGRRIVRDPLQLRKDPKAPSYWKPRSPSDAVRESMVNQF
jgi:hypothetical protein